MQKILGTRLCMEYGLTTAVESYDCVIVQLNLRQYNRCEVCILQIKIHFYDV